MYVWFKDTAKNVSEAENDSIVLDTIPPETSIITQPSNPSNSNFASFTFTSEVDSVFECQMDSGGYSATTSPKTYTGLTNGSHTFYIRAKDLAGNVDPTPAIYTWVIDTISPANPNSITGYNNFGKETAITSGNWYNYFAPYFEWSGATDSGSGIAGYYVYFGTSITADLATQRTFQSSANYTVETALTSGNIYYLFIKM